MSLRTASASLAIAGAILVSGCFTSPPQPARRPDVHLPPGGLPPGSAAPSSESQPPAPQTVPDAVPRYEPRSAYGNPAFYEVFGKRYYVLSSSADYVERGIASWYGPGFHKVLTSTREPYDMYGMTAAHKTLPLPAYVRVTNLQNGRSIVVRVNDRGPFVGNRIIDLSYTAAAKLDMLRNGTAMVEVRTVEPANSGAGPNIVVAAAAPAPAAPAPATPAPSVSAPVALPPVAADAPATAATALALAPAIAPAPVTSAPAAALFVQAGAFADPANAQGLADKLKGGGYGRVFVRNDFIGGRRMYRVRIGPVTNVPEFDRIVASLEHAGVHDAHLALE
jgi:rare lipoprotein A